LKSELKAVKIELARAKEEIARLQDQLANSRSSKSDRKEGEGKLNPPRDSSGGQQFYVDHFQSNFFAVESQAQVGLKTNSALVAYLNKVSIATLAYSTHISNANKHFPWQEFGGDAMTNFLVVLGELHAQLGQSAATAAQSAHAIGTAIEKLQLENTAINHRLQGISEQHKGAVKAVLPVFQTRQLIIEKYAEWQVYNYKKEINKAWDKKQLVEVNLAKFDTLQANPQIKDSMSSYENSMRPLLGMMEDLEVSRLQALQNCLSEICGCSCIMGPWTGNLVESVGELSKSSAIEEFATKQAIFQVPPVLTWKPELSADYLAFQRPTSEGHIGRRLSLSFSTTLRPRKPSLSPSRKPASSFEFAPPSPSSATTGTITDVIECTMMTPVILEAVRPYPGSGADSDLIFQVGDLIKLLSPLGVDLTRGTVWCTGRDLASGLQGRFPSSHVVVCTLH
jgi:hypothetical protein